MAATMATSTRLRQELAKEQQALSQKYGIAAASAQQLDLMDGEAGELPMVKLGDASIAAPFTSKLPSIRSCVDIIRQVRRGAPQRGGRLLTRRVPPRRATARSSRRCSSSRSSCCTA